VEGSVGYKGEERGREGVRNSRVKSAWRSQTTTWVAFRKALSGGFVRTCYICLEDLLLTSYPRH
jgi:hypothetical protein